jgi:hypothetical protein
MVLGFAVGRGAWISGWRIGFVPPNRCAGLRQWDGGKAARFSAYGPEIPLRQAVAPWPEVQNAEEQGKIVCKYLREGGPDAAYGASVVATFEALRTFGECHSIADQIGPDHKLFADSERLVRLSETVDVAVPDHGSPDGAWLSVQAISVSRSDSTFLCDSRSVGIAESKPTATTGNHPEMVAPQYGASFLSGSTMQSLAPGGGYSRISESTLGR